MQVCKCVLDRARLNIVCMCLPLDSTLTDLSEVGIAQSPTGCYHQRRTSTLVSICQQYAQGTHVVHYIGEVAGSFCVGQENFKVVMDGSWMHSNNLDSGTFCLESELNNFRPWTLNSLFFHFLTHRPNTQLCGSKDIYSVRQLIGRLDIEYYVGFVVYKARSSHSAKPPYWQQRNQIASKPEMWTSNMKFLL